MVRRLARRTSAALLAALLAGAPAAVGGQTLDGGAPGVVSTGLLLRQLDGVKRVLVIGAHPDDEDTSLLTALSRVWGAETAYLALTRGDGGQNLIGPELWEGLGIVRTGELEAARRIDGGRQFFTRAFDFGYSKSADEALRFWPREELLRDVVWVVRRFRPHVIVSVFSGTPRDGHGQHQAAGIMAREAFDAAGDPRRFPDQLGGGVEAWTPLKLFQVSWRRPQEATTFLETGTFDPLLGGSAFQLAMASRSQHRSQDMGSARPPGPRTSGVKLIRSRTGDDPAQGLFDGIDTTLVGLAAGLARPDEVRAALTAYRAAVERARGAFGADTRGTADALLAALSELQRAARAAGPDAPVEVRSVLHGRIGLVERAWRAAAGVWVDARADDDVVVPGQEVGVALQVWNGGDAPLLDPEPAFEVPPGWTVRAGEVRGLAPDGSVPAGALAVWSFTVDVPDDAPPSRLYYLRQPREGAFYRWPDDRSLWGLPRDPPPVHATLRLRAGPPGEAQVVTARVPWRYVGVDQARGEYAEPVLISPAVSVRTDPSSMLWPQARREARTLTVALRHEGTQGFEGTLEVEAPAGWLVTPAARPVHLDGEGTERTYSFELEPAEGAPAEGRHTLSAVVRARDGAEYREAVQVVDYEHIERAFLFQPAATTVNVVPVRVADGLRVGYIMGTGDDGPGAIRQMGADVTLLDADAVRDGAFDGFDVLVLGVRAYEAREDVRAANAQILDFARRGGTVVLQYNQYQFARGGYAPYPVDIGRPAPRVADETAPVRILEPEAPLFTTPNAITAADFDGWVQERGLYFLSEWDDHFLPLIELNDPGEEARRGALLAAPVGEGLYVYAALSFFRQFPAGVSGAYRLFANLISLRADDWNRFLATRAQGGG